MCLTRFCWLCVIWFRIYNKLCTGQLGVVVRVAGSLAVMASMYILGYVTGYYVHKCWQCYRHYTNVFTFSCSVWWMHWLIHCEVLYIFIPSWCMKLILLDVPLFSPVLWTYVKENDFICSTGICTIYALCPFYMLLKHFMLNDQFLTLIFLSPEKNREQIT